MKPLLGDKGCNEKCKSTLHQLEIETLALVLGLVLSVPGTATVSTFQDLTSPQTRQFQKEALSFIVFELILICCCYPGNYLLLRRGREQ